MGTLGKKQFRGIIGMILLVLVLVGCAHAAAPGIVLAETRITTDPGDQYDPSLSGDIIVFTNYRSADTDVYYYDLNSGQEFPVIMGPAPGNQELTDVSGGIIVYTDYWLSDVWAYDIASGTGRDITAPDKIAVGHPFNSVDPSTDGTIVAWEDSRDWNMEIYAMDHAMDPVTSEERRITTDTATDAKPAVNDGHIVWQRCAAGGTCDIYYYDWAGETTRQITATPDANERNPDIYGSNIVYQGDRDGNSDIYVYNLDTGAEKRLPLPAAQANPHIWGDNVAFDDLSSGLYHVKLWNVPSDAVFDLTSGESGQYLNQIWGNRVVYTDDRNGDLEIYMTEFTLTQNNLPPIANAGPDQTALVGEPVTFNGGMSSDPDGSIVSFAWDFGDGSSASGTTVTHAYAAAAQYTVLLTVTDNTGLTGSDTTAITVRTPAQAIEDLKTAVENLHLKNQQGYIAKLDAALKSLARGNTNTAANQLNAFMNLVNAQRGKTLTDAQANALIASAQEIIRYM